MVSGPDRGALRAPLGRREGAAPERGSGRLHHEAVQHGGVRGACARRPTARAVAARRGRPRGRRGLRAHYRSGPPPRDARGDAHPAHADRVGHPAHAGGARRTHPHASADLRGRVGSGCRQSAAIPAGAHHESASQDRGACRPARARRDRAGGRLSGRAAGIGAVALSRVRAWLLWVGMFVLSTAVLRAYRDGTDVVYAVLTYLLVILGGSVSGGRPVGFALTAAGVGSIDFFFQLPYDTLAGGEPLDGAVLIAFLTTATVPTHLLAAERARAAEAERLAAERTRLVAEADRARALRGADPPHDVVVPAGSARCRQPPTAH